MLALEPLYVNYDAVNKWLQALPHQPFQRPEGRVHGKNRDNAPGGSSASTGQLIIVFQFIVVVIIVIINNITTIAITLITVVANVFTM